MGLFSTIFGSSAKYSTQEHQLSELEIKKLVSHANVLSVGKSDENIVEQALIARRGSDGKISPQQIYETLLRLQNTYKISKQDKEGLMKIFGSIVSK